jgi:hypothetical protein
MNLKPYQMTLSFRLAQRNDFFVPLNQSIPKGMPHHRLMTVSCFAYMDVYASTHPTFCVAGMHMHAIVAEVETVALTIIALSVRPDCRFGLCLSGRGRAHRSQRSRCTTSASGSHAPKRTHGRGCGDDAIRMAGCGRYPMACFSHHTTSECRSP